MVEHIKRGGFSRYELYNLNDDPNEDNNLAASRPERLDRMKKAFLPLHKDIVSQGPMLRMNGDRPSKPLSQDPPARMKLSRPRPALGQGTMSGEVTSSSVLLQTRLTAHTQLDVTFYNDEGRTLYGFQIPEMTDTDE